MGQVACHCGKPLRHFSGSRARGGGCRCEIPSSFTSFTLHRFVPRLRRRRNCLRADSEHTRIPRDIRYKNLFDRTYEKRFIQGRSGRLFGEQIHGRPSQVIAAGLQFAFDRPYEGYFDFSPLLYKQWVYSGLPWTGFEPGLAHGTLDLNLTWAPEDYVPLGFLPDTIPLATSGRMQIMDEGGGVTLWANCPPTCFREEAKHFGLKSIPRRRCLGGLQRSSNALGGKHEGRVVLSRRRRASFVANGCPVAFTSGGLVYPAENPRAKIFVANIRTEHN